MSAVEDLDKTFEHYFFADQTIKDHLAYFLSSTTTEDQASKKKMLCLYGVPGSGKKTMLKGLCKGLGYRLVSVKLGEVTNEDGHVVGAFRTDLNAIAARIVHALDGLKGERVALILEDLDKINPPALHDGSVNFFEVLEQMQQYALQNNYKLEQVELSEVVFFATAKNLALVPSSLRQQLQVVRIPSYSEQDKLKIVENYLLPQILESLEMEGRVEFSANALVRLIREYTREGGLDQARRELEIITKKLQVRPHTLNGRPIHRIYRNHLEKYLGSPRFPVKQDYAEDHVGTVALLGKSERGGCILVLEALALAGKGGVVITGNTDRLFRESVRVAVSYLRTRAGTYGIDQNFISRFDLHLHVQYGQIPKFGVSAGSGILIALVSALSGRPVKEKLGVTGEISLKGSILGVDDIRDKVLGARQEGVSTIVLPKENQRDVERLSGEIKRGIEISLVDNADDLLAQAIKWQ